MVHFNDLETLIQGLSRTNAVFKYFQGLKFREKIPGLSRTFMDAWEHYIQVDETRHGDMHTAVVNNDQ